MARLFGTDGFRGKAGEVVTRERALKVGECLGLMALDLAAGVCAPGSQLSAPRILIGEDTRISSPMLRDALAEGVASKGADAFIMGVTTTPSVAFVTKHEGFSFGVMITASHNPYFDNGIKVISHTGAKLSETETGRIEEYLADETAPTSAPATGAGAGNRGSIAKYPEGVDIYKSFLCSVIRDEAADLSGKKVVIDCAFGAASFIAPEVLRETKARLTVTADTPDGLNINDGVGSTHLEALSREVIKHHADMGFAYDGDADRCLMVDEGGREVSGDQIIYLMALDLMRRGKLPHSKVALTVMSNLGVLKALDRAGIGYEITDVGDKYVSECMSREGLALGGEQSGHIIFGDYLETGDGILTSVMVMSALGRLGTAPGALLSDALPYPQVLKNIRVLDKASALSHPLVMAAVKEAEEGLLRGGRLLIRPSGTEPLIRVMAEAADKSACEAAADTVIAAIRSAGLSEDSP